MGERRHFYHKQAVTEYDRNYQPFHFHPLPLAGKESFKMYTTQEPPLQRKRRIQPPSGDFDDNYLLMGKSTEKFGEATLIRDRNPLSKVNSYYEEPRPVYENGDHYENQHHKTTKVGKPKYAKQEEKNVTALPLTPDTPRVENHKQIVNHHSKDERKKTKKEAVPRRARSMERPKPKPPAPQPHYQAPAMQPAASNAKPRPQTAIGRESEYQGNYNWKTSQIHNLNTQKPLLNTEEIFYRSHLNPPKNVKMPWNTEYRQRYTQYRFITEEEYKRRQSILDKHHVDNSPLQERIRPVIVTSTNARRARTPSPSKPGLEIVTVEGEDFTSKDILNPQRLGFPLGPRRMMLSEYKSHFKNYWDQAGKKEKTQPDPTQATYWLQELQELRRRAQEFKKRARGTHFSREHMAQLLAHENRYWDIPNSVQSARGRVETSGGHLEKEKLLDEGTDGEDYVEEQPNESTHLPVEDSDDESSDYASSLTPREEKRLAKKQQKSKPQQRQRSSSKPRPSSQKTKEPLRVTESREQNGKNGRGSPTPSSHDSLYQSWPHQKVYDDSKYRSDSQYSGSEAGSSYREVRPVSRQGTKEIPSRSSPTFPHRVLGASQQGRLATPKMQVAQAATGNFQRHHADRTTPNMGGALLTCPPGKGFSEPRVPTNKMSHTVGELPSERNFTVSATASLRPAGKPTIDPHNIVEEPRVVPRLDETASSDHMTSVSSLSQRPSSRGQPVGYVFTGNAQPPQQREPSLVGSRELSLSVRSNASSCASSSTHSLAVQTLERAKKRKEELLGK